MRCPGAVTPFQDEAVEILHRSCMELGSCCIVPEWSFGAVASFLNGAFELLNNPSYNWYYRYHDVKNADIDDLISTGSYIVIKVNNEACKSCCIAKAKGAGDRQKMFHLNIKLSI